MFKPSWARIISGEQEGVYGYITVNYLNGLLVNSSEHVGALDLGGASTQITYNANVDLLANLFNIQLGDAVNEDVYTHSFLYFGINEATRRANQRVVDTTSAVHTTNKGIRVYNSPCYNVGALLNFTDIDNVRVLINGTGNYTACTEILSPLLVKNALCFTSADGLVHNDRACSIAGVYQPPVYGNYVAFSGFSYTYDFLGLAGNASLSELKAATKELCEMPYDKVLALHPKVRPLLRTRHARTHR